MQKYYRLVTTSFGMTLAIAIYLGHLFFFSPSSQSLEKTKSEKNPENEEIYSEELPIPPDTGTPEGESTPGGTRPETLCKQTPTPVTAIVANNGKDFTLSSHPTFWFYVPYTPEETRYIEFALLNPQQQKTIYRTAIQTITTPGIIKITIPPEQQYEIESQKNYRWNLMLYCSANQTDEPDVVLNGWVQRVSINTELDSQLKTATSNSYRIYLNNKIWYDAINAIAQQHFANPDNSELYSAWIEILQSLGKEELKQERLAESTLIPVN